MEHDFQEFQLTDLLSFLDPRPSSFLLQSRFGKSTAMYASWLVSLIVIGEFATGKITDGLWTMNNYGKTFDTVDWSQFDEIDEDGGEDEDEDDDDE